MAINARALFEQHIHGLHVRGHQGYGHCPFHEDNRESFSVDLQTGLWTCHAGCGNGNAEQFAERFGLAPPEDVRPGSREILAYDYHDERGALLFQVVRFAPKNFRQRRPDDSGAWVWNLAGVRRVPYRLREILAAIARGETVYVVEGEKDADRLASLGLAATTNPGGAGKWRDQYVPHFKGARIIIIPDNDETGKQHAQQVAASLQGVAADVKIVELLGLPPKGDVSDWLNQGHTAEELSRFADQVEGMPPPAAPARAAAVATGPVLLRLAEVEPAAVRWIWPGYIPLAKLSLWDGDPDLGKSLTSIDLAARVTRGAPMPDGSCGDLAGACGVVILTAEDDPADTVRPRFDAAGGDASRVVLLRAVRDAQGERLPTIADLDALEAARRRVNAALVIVDPLMAYLPDERDAHKDHDVRRALAPLADYAATSGAGVLTIRHLNKASSSNPLYRGGGSIGIIGAARAGCLFALDPNDPTGERRIMAPHKHNLAPKAPALVYRIAAEPVAGLGQIPRIEWLGSSDYTVGQLIDVPATAEERTELDEAADFLADALRPGPAFAKKITTDAREAGLTYRTLRRAKSRLRVHSDRIGATGPWFWYLPDLPAAAVTAFEEREGG